MSVTIFYFSGRGNSLIAARMLADKIKDAKLIPVAKALKDKVDFSADCIGLVFPVIDLGIPGIIAEFISKLEPDGKDKYIFAAVATGGMPAGTLIQLRNRLKKKDLKLSAGYYLVADGKQESLDQWPSLTDEIAENVKRRKNTEAEKVKFVDRYILTGLANKLAALIVPKEDKKFYVNEDCNGCGICSKVCPVQNINLADGKPVWLHRCEQCGACFNWCPKKALQGTNLAARTYHLNPNVKLKDFIID